MDIYKTLEELSRKQDLILEMLNNKQNDNDHGKVFDLMELGQILHVSRRTIATWTKEGLLPHSRIGNKIYVSEEQLQKFLTDAAETHVSIDLREGGMK